MIRSNLFKLAQQMRPASSMTFKSQSFKGMSLFFNNSNSGNPFGGQQKRMYSGGRPEKSVFHERALELMRGFDKIQAEKLSLDADFNKDLGLDSLDVVEVLMAVEDEFMIEIPDQEADNMHNLRQAVDFVYERWTPEHYV